jgi:endoglycosylceramidase
MVGTAEAWGVPLFLGELGAPAEAENAGAYMNMLYRRLDEGFLSGAQWVYTPGWTPEAKDGWNMEDLSVVDDVGRGRPNFRVRPFPRRIAGTPSSLVVTAEADLLANFIELTWDHNPAMGETEIFLDAGGFFGGAGEVIETSGAELLCSKKEDLLLCASPVAGEKRVRVRAARPEQAAADGGCGFVAVNGLGGWSALFVAPLVWVARRRARRR